PQKSFLLSSFRVSTADAAPLRGPIRFRLLSPVWLPPGSKHPIMVWEKDSTVFRPSEAMAIADKDGATLCGTIQLTDLNASLAVLEGTALQPANGPAQLTVSELRTPLDGSQQGVEEGVTIPVLIR